MKSIKLIKYVCLALTVIFGGFTIGLVVIGMTDILAFGLIMTGICALLTWRADQDVKKQKSFGGKYGRRSKKTNDS